MGSIIFLHSDYYDLVLYIITSQSKEKQRSNFDSLYNGNNERHLEVPIYWCIGTIIYNIRNLPVIFTSEKVKCFFEISFLRL